MKQCNSKKRPKEAGSTPEDPPCSKQPLPQENKNEKGGVGGGCRSAKAEGSSQAKENEQPKDVKLTTIDTTLPLNGSLTTTQSISNTPNHESTPDSSCMQLGEEKMREVGSVEGEDSVVLRHQNAATRVERKTGRLPLRERDNWQNGGERAEQVTELVECSEE